jgi:hypothetical protein
MSDREATIATWFVADSKQDASFFPQIGSQSDAPEAQRVYWRCATVFFASSLAANPSLRHAFYTNTELPVIDGVALTDLFDRWKIEVIHLPITYRLAKGSAKSWGNQFYVFDVMEHHATNMRADPLVLLDSDCLFIRPADTLLDAVRVHRALTYELGYEAYGRGSGINGQTREGLAEFVARCGGPRLTEVPYCGGEIYAATAEANCSLARQARALWPEVLAQAADAPREEAHFLSALYAMQKIEIGTAQRFISRMWTTFKHSTVRPSDTNLIIWHLPSEKKTGFADLFFQLIDAGLDDPRIHGSAMGLTAENFARVMGIPRRHPAKFARDLALKLREKLPLGS